MVVENNSATGGPLSHQPVFGLGPETQVLRGLGTGYLGASTPLEDDALDDFFQALVSSITGMDGKVIFPRFQEEPPVPPNFEKDWAAVGILDHTPDWSAAMVHSEDQDEFRRHELLDVLASFYGPNAGYNCGVLSDGLQIAQNREPLTLSGMGLVETLGPKRAPSLVKMRWRNRSDLHITIKRQRKRVYPVLSLESADVGLEAESGGKLVINTTVNIVNED